VNGGGLQIIKPLSPLPWVYYTDIDATTQPGYSGTPLIALTGHFAGNASTGLQLASISSVKGMIISGFRRTGINVAGSDNRVIGNYIGTSLDGTSPRPNGFAAVEVAHNGNQIGGTNPGDRNIIAGTVRFSGGSEFSPNILAGNYIGVDVTGTKSLGGGQLIVHGTHHRIGGTTPAERNVIAAKSAERLCCLSRHHLAI
jgi:hypothetical protein